MRRALGLVLVICSSLCSAFNTYPLFKQCDPRWKDIPMGTKGPGEDSTICGEGCAMSSLSMVLAGTGATVNGAPADPATLNAWLEANNGYTCGGNDCNDLVLNIVSKLNASYQLLGEVPPPPLTFIQLGLLRGDVAFLAHIKHLHHFVLLTGYDQSQPQSEAFFVNDPYYNTTQYNYSDIQDVLMYTGWQMKNDTVDLESELSLLQPLESELSLLQPLQPVQPVQSSVIPRQYPLYKQCNPFWGNDTIVSKTICQVGCFLSSISMALAANDVLINGAESTPDTFNKWMQQHNGYDDTNDLSEDVVPKINPEHVAWNETIGMHRTNDIPLSKIQQLLMSGEPVIANVMKGRHFVLVIGWDESDTDKLLVNDPGFNTHSYSYANDVVGWRLFQMSMPCSDAKPCSKSAGKR